MTDRPIPLFDRERDRREAVERAMAAAENWLACKACGRMTDAVEAAMDDAMRDLLRANRRLARAREQDRA